MSVPSFIKIENGSDGGPGLQTLQGAFLPRKSVNINVSRAAAPKIALMAASRYDCDIN